MCVDPDDTAGTVRSVYQAEILTQEGLLKARILETQSPINGGTAVGRWLTTSANWSVS